MTEFFLAKGRFAAEDARALEVFSRPWDLLVEGPAGPAPCAVVDYLGVPGITIMHEHYGTPVKLSGMPPPGQLVLGIPVGNSAASSAHGRPLTDHQLYALADSPIETRYRQGQNVLAIHLDVDQDFGPELDRVVDRLLSAGRTDAFADTRPEIRRLATCLFDMVRDKKDQPHAGPQAHDRTVRALIFEALANAVLPDRLDGLEGAKSAPDRALRLALEYLRTSPSCASVSELCQDAGINQRALQRAVRAVYGCTAVQLLQKWRLHKARDLLLDAGPADTTVSRIAADLGFSDFGRFAGHYSAAFGEYPSDTLATPPSRRVAAPLLKMP